MGAERGKGGRRRIYSKETKRKGSRGRSKGKEQAKGRKGKAIRERKSNYTKPSTRGGRVGKRLSHI